MPHALSREIANTVENSDLAQTRNFACPSNRSANLRHDGIAAYAENLAQEPRSAFAPASNETVPLQIQFGEIQAQNHERFFRQYPPTADAPDSIRKTKPLAKIAQSFHIASFLLARQGCCRQVEAKRRHRSAVEEFH